MKDKTIKSRASRVERKKKLQKYSKIVLLLLLLLLGIVYIIISILFNNGSFSVTMARDLYLKNGIVIYEDPDYKVFRTELYAETLERLDNISYKWLPDNLHELPGGSNNGNNYVVYTFFIEHLGEQVTDYWSEIIIDDIVRDVDEAMRVRVYRDGNEKTYAKMSRNGVPEPGTEPFVDDTLIVREHVENFSPGDLHKYTLVIWLEGSDPECTDNILGGIFKIHMDFKSEVIEK